MLISVLDPRKKFHENPKFLALNNIALKNSRFLVLEKYFFQNQQLLVLGPVKKILFKIQDPSKNY